jgi:hypothetical protein
MRSKVMKSRGYKSRLPIRLACSLTPKKRNSGPGDPTIQHNRKQQKGDRKCRIIVESMSVNKKRTP